MPTGRLGVARVDRRCSPDGENSNVTPEMTNRHMRTRQRRLEGWMGSPDALAEWQNRPLDPTGLALPVLPGFVSAAAHSTPRLRGRTALSCHQAFRAGRPETFRRAATPSGRVFHLPRSFELATCQRVGANDSGTTAERQQDESHVCDTLSCKADTNQPATPLNKQHNRLLPNERVMSNVDVSRRGSRLRHLGRSSGGVGRP